MSLQSWLEIIFFFALLAISTPLLGSYMARVYGGEKAPGDRFFLPVERVCYRLCRIDPDSEQRWRGYVMSLLAFTLVGGLLTYACRGTADTAGRPAGSRAAQVSASRRARCRLGD